MKENMLVVLHQKELSDDEELRYISQVSEGMEYLHQQSVLHCDLAARNISLNFVSLCMLGILLLLLEELYAWSIEPIRLVTTTNNY